MASASNSCLGAPRWNGNLVAKSQASCCRAAESTGALVESAGSDSDTSSEDEKTIETRRPRLLQCASVIPRHATQRHDAKGGSVATRSVFPSLHPEARIGEKRCHMSMLTGRSS